MISFDPPSEELLKKLREENGAEAVREVEDTETERTFVLVKPKNPRAHLDRMAALSANEKKRIDAAEGLVKSCVLYPPKEILKQVFEEEPGLILSLAETASELMGMRHLTVKK